MKSQWVIEKTQYFPIEAKTLIDAKRKASQMLYGKTSPVLVPKGYDCLNHRLWWEHRRWLTCTHPSVKHCRHSDAFKGRYISAELAEVFEPPKPLGAAIEAVIDGAEEALKKL